MADTVPRSRTWASRGLVAVVVIVLIGLAVWAFGRRLIYFPAGAPPPVAELWPAARAVEFTTGDGLELTAWYRQEGPVAVMVLPGNGGNRAGRVPLGRAFAEAGLSVLLVEYRGYGGNPGRPTEAGLAADARAAEAWLRARPGIDDVVVFGESIGAAVAVDLATTRRPAALVLRSPFTALVDVARRHYGPVPGWVLPDRYPVRERISDIDAPVLVVAGDADTIVPPDLSRRVFAAAQEPKALVVVPGAGHNDAALATGPPLTNAVVGFLGRQGLPLDDGGG